GRLPRLRAVQSCAHRRRDCRYGEEERGGDRGRAETEIPHLHERSAAEGHGVRGHAVVARRDQRQHGLPRVREPAMKMKAYPSFDEYLADQAPRNQNIIRTLRRFVKRVAPQLKEFVKWGNGCWVRGTVPVAYVYSAPDHVQFGFFHGAALKDPKGLLT